MDKAVTFGELLKALRKRAHLSQEELARALGYSRTLITHLERGQRQPDLVMVKTAFVAALGLEHDSELSTRLVTLAQLARTDRQALAPTTLETSTPVRNNLSPDLTRFINRDRELQQIMQLIDTQRLLTLTGAGGVGKTRLAIELGRRILASSVREVWLVEFANVLEPARLSMAVANTLGLSDQAGHNLETLSTALCGSNALLILDNCEHLAEGCAALVEALMRNCPELSVLITSREALSVAGEQIWRVPPLEIPASVVSLDQTRLYAAISLFEQQARAVLPEFTLTLTNIATVMEICRRLDGIPLAIEIAAGHVSTLALRDIDAALKDRLDVLGIDTRRGLPRHRTLRATMDWSYQLLSPPARLLLARLSIFTGDFSATAAWDICEGNLPLLYELSQKSLVVVHRHDQEVSYRLLQTTQYYAAERLLELPQAERDRLIERFLKFYVSLVEQTMDLGGRDVDIWVNQIAAEIANIRKAFGLARPYAEIDGGEAMLRLAGGLRPYRQYRGDVEEGLQWLNEALSKATSVPVEALAKANLAKAALTVRSVESDALAIAQLALTQFTLANDRTGMAWSLEMVADNGRTHDGAPGQQAAALFRELGSQAGLGRALRSLGWNAYLRGDLDESLRYFVEALAVAREIDDRNVIISCLRNISNLDAQQALRLCEQEVLRARSLDNLELLALVLQQCGAQLVNMGRFAEAKTVLLESMALWRQIDRLWSIVGGVVYCGLILGLAYWGLGLDASAMTLWEEALQYSDELLDRRTSQWIGAHLSLLRGDFGQSEQRFRGVLKRNQQIGGVRGQTLILIMLGDVNKQAGRPVKGMTLMGAAFAAASTSEPSFERAPSAIHQRLLAQAYANRSDPILATAWDRGVAMSLAEAVDFAL